MNRFGYLLAGAAFVVQAPRLVLTILAADRLPVEAQVEQQLLAVAALGTAIVLTGGGMFLAHAALTAPRWRLALGISWVLVLTASAGLVAPAIAGGLADRRLHEVISTSPVRTAWALLASLAHELTAAGCMLAAAASSRKETIEELELRLYAERDAAVAKAEEEIAVARADREIAVARMERDSALARAERAERELSAMTELYQAFVGELASLPEELGSQPERFPCEGCGRSFRSRQARSGHLRSCPGRSATPPSRGEPAREQPSELAKAAMTAEPSLEPAQSTLRRAEES